MKVLRNIRGLKKALIDVGKLGFVPTMGGLHNSHISLIKESQKRSTKTIVSIYVNPKQFNNSADFLKYPRNLIKDLKILKKTNVDYVYLPSTKEIYKQKFKKIIVSKKEKILCAKLRKGHFEGVIDIMRRFIKIIKPKLIFMGEKDFQQLFFVKKLLSNNKVIKLISCKTIRDKNFVALSSRNYLLNKKNLHDVSLITKNLIKFKKDIKKFSNIKKKISFKKKELINKFNIKIDYLELRSEKNLSSYKKYNKSRLFVAYYLSKVRLIDNFS